VVAYSVREPRLRIQVQHEQLLAIEADLGEGRVLTEEAQLDDLVVAVISPESNRHHARVVRVEVPDFGVAVAAGDPECVRSYVHTVQVGQALALGQQQHEFCTCTPGHHCQLSAVLVSAREHN